ncbi:MAG: T9SS type A sorting domain-containing protein [Bernardetiaceae bacterium]|nr:T9SS type A sorting domain-containing protein [Bernardetiaceae bacterium]
MRKTYHHSHLLSLCLIGLLSVGLLSCTQEREETQGEQQPTTMAELLASRDDGGKALFKYTKAAELMKLHAAIREWDPESGVDLQYEGGYQSIEFESALRRIANRRLEEDFEWDWVERGPGNIAGRMRIVAQDLADPSGETWLSGAASGGIWRTTDNGRTFNKVATGLDNLAVATLVQSAANPSVWYAGTGEAGLVTFQLTGVSGSGIYKSTDGGNTWQVIPSTQNNNFANVNRLIIDPNDENVVLACNSTGQFFESSANYGIWKTTDGGQNWERKDNPTLPPIQIIADPTDFNTMYYTMYGRGVYKSTDAGETWEQTSFEDVVRADLPRNQANNDLGVGRPELAISPSNPNILYVSLDIPVGGTSRLVYSDDKGETWKVVARQNGTQEIRDYLGGQGWFDNCIAVDPEDPYRVFFAGVDIWSARIIEGSLAGDDNEYQVGNFIRISDAYNNQATNNANRLHPDHHYLNFIGSRLISSNDGGIAYSDNKGTSWIEVDRTANLNTSQFYDARRHPTENRYIGGMQDNGTAMSISANPSASGSYREVLGGDGFECVWHAEDPDKILISLYSNIIFKSTNGSTFRPSVTGLDDAGQGSAPFFTRVTNSHRDPDRVYAVGSGGVWVSNNFGDRWTQTRITTGWNWNGNNCFNTVKVSDADPRVVWAGGGMSRNSSIFVSTNRGANFNATANSGFNIGLSTGLATHPTDPRTAYVLFSQRGAPKILRTTNLGESWEDITGFQGRRTSNNGFPDVAVHSMVVLPNDVLLAGTEIGLFISKNNGGNWEFLDNGFPPVVSWNMHVMPNDGQLVVSTFGRGIWSADIGAIYPEPESLDGEEEEEEEEEPTGLFNREPTKSLNAFPNPTTDIVRVELPEENNANYEITVFDMQGRSIETRKARGGAILDLSLGNLPKGTYLIKATDGKTVYAQKVIRE